MSLGTCIACASLPAPTKSLGPVATTGLCALAGGVARTRAGPRRLADTLRPSRGRSSAVERRLRPGLRSRLSPLARLRASLGRGVVGGSTCPFALLAVLSPRSAAQSLTLVCRYHGRGSNMRQPICSTQLNGSKPRLVRREDRKSVV